MWCGVVWRGVVWCGVVWCGVVWCGVVWCKVGWSKEKRDVDEDGSNEKNIKMFMTMETTIKIFIRRKNEKKT